MTALLLSRLARRAAARIVPPWMCGHYEDDVAALCEEYRREWEGRA